VELGEVDVFIAVEGAVLENVNVNYWEGFTNSLRYCFIP